MPLDIEDREIGGEHPRLRGTDSLPPPDRSGGRERLPIRGMDDAPRREEGKERGKHRKKHHSQDGHQAPSLPDGGSTAQTLGRTASFTVIFAFFFSSTRYASTVFSPFWFRNAARICSFTMASGTFFPSRTIVAECSA